MYTVTRQDADGTVLAVSCPRRVVIEQLMKGMQFEAAMYQVCEHFCLFPTCCILTFCLQRLLFLFVFFFFSNSALVRYLLLFFFSVLVQWHLSQRLSLTLLPSLSVLG